MCVFGGTIGVQKRTLHPLAVVSHLMWVLGIEPRSLARAASALKLWGHLSHPKVILDSEQCHDGWWKGGAWES